MSRLNLLGVALLLVSVPVLAHDTWLFASDNAKGEVRLDLTSGMAFPKRDYAPKADRVERAWGLDDAGPIAVSKPRRNTQALSFSAPPPTSSSSYAVQLLPKSLALGDVEVQSYLEEIHAAPAMLQRWQQQRRWREEYRKHSKALLLRETSCPQLGTQALGLGLELLIEADVCALKAGSLLPVRALHGGQPKADLALGLVGSNAKEQGSAVTDAQGRALLSVPAAGPWLLRATDLRPVESEMLDWQSDFSTLTFTVR